MKLEDIQLARVPQAELLPPDQFRLARAAKWAEYSQILEYGAGLKVTDLATRDKAAEVGRLLQTAGRELKDFYTPLKRAFDLAKQPVLDQEKADLAQLDEVKMALAGQVGRFQAELDRLHREEERIAREAARKAAEERQIAEALELEAAGFKEEAAERLDTPLMAPAVIVAAAPKKVAGFVERTTWKARVWDFPLLVKSVAQGQVSISALTADQSWLNTEAGKYGEGFNVPGVTAEKEVNSHFRS